MISIKQIYNQLSEEKKTSFWSMTSAFVLATITGWLGFSVSFLAVDTVKQEELRYQQIEYLGDLYQQFNQHTMPLFLDLYGNLKNNSFTVSYYYNIKDNIVLNIDSVTPYLQKSYIYLSEEERNKFSNALQLMTLGSTSIKLSNPINHRLTYTQYKDSVSELIKSLTISEVQLNIYKATQVDTTGYNLYECIYSIDSLYYKPETADSVSISMLSSTLLKFFIEPLFDIQTVYREILLPNEPPYINKIYLWTRKVLTSPMLFVLILWFVIIFFVWFVIIIRVFPHSPQKKDQLYELLKNEAMLAPQLDILTQRYTNLLRNIFDLKTKINNDVYMDNPKRIADEIEKILNPDL